MRLILLISIQAYLAISALRCGEPAFVVGSLFVGMAVLYHGYADINDLHSSRSPFGTSNRRKLDAKDKNNLNTAENKTSDSKPGAADASNKALQDKVTSRINRRLFIVLCVLSAIIPVGLVVSRLFFKSSGNVPKEHVFFGTSAGWLWVAAFGAAIMAAFLYISFKEGAGRKLSLERSPRLNVFLFLLALIPAAMLMIIMVARVSAFLSPTYDMGIFTQMFHNMKTTGADHDVGTGRYAFFQPCRPFLCSLLYDHSVHRDPSSTSDSGRLSGVIARSSSEAVFSREKRGALLRPSVFSCRVCSEQFVRSP